MPHTKQHKKPMCASNCPRCACRIIMDMIDDVDERCMEADGPVTPTSEEITDREICKIYELAKRCR